MNIYNYLYGLGLEEVSAFDFYRDIFPKGSFERKGQYEDKKPNGIIIEITSDKKDDGIQKVLRHTVTDELDKIDEVTKRDNFCLMSPISYIGKSRKSENARFMYAMAIDVDGIIDEKHIDYLMYQCENGHNMLKFVWGLPKPTYIVSSGTGVHLYYVFEKPIPLFPNIVKELEKLKKRLTWQAWTQGATDLVDSIQYESLFQGFRMVGTITKKETRTTAFKYSNKVTVEYLNKFVPKDYMATEFTYKSDLTLTAAKEKYPEWYEKRVVNKQSKESWVCKKDLYNWWIRKIYEGATQGHRYWCVMTLATYAKKCGVSYEQLEKDALGLVEFLNSKGDEFTLEDVMHALEAYNDSYITYPIDAIVARTDIKIEKNKRNGRKQEIHIKTVNALRKFRRDELGEDEYKNNGRPLGSKDKKPRKNKSSIVKEWRKNNPNGKKIECERETRLSRHTILKWWN